MLKYSLHLQVCLILQPILLWNLFCSHKWDINNMLWGFKWDLIYHPYFICCAIELKTLWARKYWNCYFRLSADFSPWSYNNTKHQISFICFLLTILSAEVKSCSSGEVAWDEGRQSHQIEVISISIKCPPQTDNLRTKHACFISPLSCNRDISTTQKDHSRPWYFIFQNSLPSNGWAWLCFISFSPSCRYSLEIGFYVSSQLTTGCPDETFSLSMSNEIRICTKKLGKADCSLLSS